MYASPNANLNGSNENNMEDFLLGKKNVDELLRAKQREEIVSIISMSFRSTVDITNLFLFKKKNFLASCNSCGRKSLLIIQC